MRLVLECVDLVLEFEGFVEGLGCGAPSPPLEVKFRICGLRWRVFKRTNGRQGVDIWWTSQFRRHYPYVNVYYPTIHN